MKKLSFIVMACLMVLSLTQCKKNEPSANNNTDNGDRVSITLKLENGGQRVHPEEENGLANVVYDNGDVVYVGSNGKYMGYLTYNGSLFTGSINAAVTEGQPLQFVFMGGQDFHTSLTENSTPNYTFNIGAQSNGLAVISCAASNEDFSLTNLSYTAYLRNKCALVKFALSEETDAAITLQDLKTEATVGFDGTVTNGTATGDIVTYGTGSTRYAVVLSDQAEVTSGSISVQGYIGTFSIPTAAYTNAFLTDASMTLTKNVVDLSLLTDSYVAKNGDILINTLNGNYKISIADGANVTLSNANITCLTNAGDWAGITCVGDATITLEGTNNVKSGWDGTYCFHPGIEIPEGKTLTINGSGTLNASCYNVNPEPSKRWGSGAGIGGVYKTDCGNIIIESGTVIAEGGAGAAGIGSGMGGSIGNITIYGGTVTAKGGDGGAGIGCGFGNNPAGNTCSSCGNITISGGDVTATGGQWAAGIGSGIAYGFGQSSGFSTSTCGDISITGGTIVATGGGAGSIQGLGGLSSPDYCDGGAGIGTGASVDKSIAGESAYNSHAGKSSCGNITIGSGVTSVTATKGSYAENSIGKNHSNNQGTCGTVNIGGTVYPNGANPNLSDGATYIYPAPAEPQIIDLSTLTAAYTAIDGYILTGTLSGNYKISIAGGATVTLRDVTINGTSGSNYKWAGLTCEGDATIILEGSNTVKGFYNEYPGILVAQGSTLTIQGSSGSLTASSNGYAAGIGGGWVSDISCGNIVINSGNITATGANNCAGIGGGRYGSCGNISINGGHIIATTGYQGAGIGGGTYGSCGNITINGGHIIATGGEYAAGIGGGSTSTSSCGTITINGGSGEATKGDNAQHSIGAGYQSSCGTVTINGVTGYISTSPYSWSL